MGLGLPAHRLEVVGHLGAAAQAVGAAEGRRVDGQIVDADRPVESQVLVVHVGVIELVLDSHFRADIQLMLSPRTRKERSSHQPGFSTGMRPSSTATSNGFARVCNGRDTRAWTRADS